MAGMEGTGGAGLEGGMGVLPPESLGGSYGSGYSSGVQGIKMHTFSYDLVLVK